LANRLAASIKLWFRLHEEAIFEAERGLALAPNDATMLGAMSSVLIWAGRPKEAIEFAEFEMRYDPRRVHFALCRLGMAHFWLEKYDQAVSYFERSLSHNPEQVWPVLPLLAATYAHLGRDKEAEAVLKKYQEQQPEIQDLREFMLHWPIKDLEVSNRFADGLLKAGLEGKPSGYYKISEENRLSGEEVSKSLFGRTTTGFVAIYGSKHWVEFTKAGKEIKLWTESGWTDSGRAWVEGDLCCFQWEKLHGGVKNCNYIYHNPDGTQEERKEYLLLTESWITSFSLVD
jgi:tetratricopeptide (TPR) repeat protein